ncbi:MAG: rhodanese-like domain-containing protein [Desulfobacteraceae bacterium]|nr:MAG: rhodanese-like domain-containing protein [Desulfobacteraceae bacterium]
MKSNTIKLITVLFAMMFLAVGCVGSKDPKPAKAEWMYDELVDVAFVKQHVTVPMEENVMIIDSRPYKAKYVKGHIPGAVSIPWTKFDEKKDLLPKNKDALLIFYCGGVECKLSHKSAKKAKSMGYTNVKVLPTGFPSWKKQKGEYPSVSAEYVAKVVADNTGMIVDSRPLETKYNKGHIPSAISIPFSKFETLKGKLPRDPATPVIFYCGGLHCRLSHKSARESIKMGYTNVKVFSEGYPAWKKLYGASAQAMAVKAGEVEGSIDLARFNEIMSKNPSSIMLVDVRDADEFAKAAITGSVNIPVDKLEAKAKELPKDKPIVFICPTGARSGEAFYMLQDVMPSLKDVFYVEAEVTFNKDGSYKLKKTE